MSKIVPLNSLRTFVLLSKDVKGLVARGSLITSGAVQFEVHSPGCYSPKTSLLVPVLIVSRRKTLLPQRSPLPRSHLKFLPRVLTAVISAYPVATRTFTSLQSLSSCHSTAAAFSSENKLSRGKPHATCAAQVCVAKTLIVRLLLNE